MIWRRLAFALPLVVVLSACANTCSGDEETPSSQSSAVKPVPREGGSRFAKPFVPGQPMELPAKDAAY